MIVLCFATYVCCHPCFFRDVSFLNKEHEDGKVNHPFLKKLPENAEAAVILTGSVPFLEKAVSVFIRLAQPSVLGDLPEVDIPTRSVCLFCCISSLQLHP